MGGFFARLAGGGGGNRRPATEETGTTGPSKVTEQDKAILQLKLQRDKLQKYQKQINTQLEREREVAKQLLRDGKKERAKLLLKKKRYLESLLDKTDTQMDNLQQMVETLEYTQVEMQVVEGLKQGNESLEAMHKIMSLEDVEKIMAETQDAIEYQQEIDELLGQRLTEEDEDAVAAELAAIIAGEMPEVPPSKLPVAEDDQEIQLPEVPTHQLGLEEEEPAKEKKKQKEPAVELA